MRETFTTLLLIVLTAYAFAQEAEPKILYVVDSIPVIDASEEGFGSLNEEDIQELRVVTNKAEIEKYGDKSQNKVILITTKAYANRPEELKKIPSVKAMAKINGRWHMKNSSTPYSGPFIDYFLNGKKQGEGYFKNGLVDGVRTVYYHDGKKNFQRNYSSGVENGEAEQYYANGQLKFKGDFRNGKEDGLWKEWYSTGTLKREAAFKLGKALPTKEQEKFHSLLTKAGHQFKAEDFQEAVKTLDKAIEQNPSISDAYFERATAYFYQFKFEEAIQDYNKALELESLYVQALSNRAFARIRKYEFKNSRTLSRTNGVTIMASKDKVEIPKEELTQICSDLSNSYQLGDKKQMLVEAIETYCK